MIIFCDYQMIMVETKDLILLPFWQTSRVIPGYHCGFPLFHRFIIELTASIKYSYISNLSPNLGRTTAPLIKSFISNIFSIFIRIKRDQIYYSRYLNYLIVQVWIVYMLLRSDLYRKKLNARLSTLSLLFNSMKPHVVGTKKNRHDETIL